MTRPLIPFVQNGYYASRNWIPLVKGNGFTTSGGGEQEEVWETASGSIVTFDAVAAPLRQLSVAVEPVQNLNGYDNPWPAGGGKNLIDMSWFTTRTVNDVTFTKNSDGSVTLSGTASSTINLNGTTFTLPAGTYTISGSIFNNQLYLYDQGANTAIVESANGTSRTVTTTEDKTVYLRLRVGGGSTVSGTVKPQLEVGSTATSFAPYSNICPITGFDSVKVNRTGVNVWDEEWEQGQINASTGQNASHSSRIRSKNYIPVVSGASYYFKCPNKLEKFMYDADKNYLGLIPNDSDLNNVVRTIPDNCAYIRISPYSAYGPVYNNDISINYPATDTEYHAYSGNEYTIQLGEAVYGGTLDVVNGKMTVDKVAITIDGVNVRANSSDKYGQNTRANILYQTGFKAKYDGASTFCISDKLHASYKGVITSYEDVIAGDVRVFPHSFALLVNFPPSFGVTNTQTANEWFAANTPMVCYPLATPFELTLTPEQISTLQGTNNVWSDAGDVTVEYRAQ